MEKEFLWTIILSILSSATSSAIINGIFSIVTNRINEKNKKKDKEKKDKDDYLQKKENVYIGAINWLLLIRRGFDFTQDQLRDNKDLKEKYSYETKQFMEISAKLRLYSTDRIYTLFSHLNKYQDYSYSNGWRLSEEYKAKFIDKVNILSDLMKADLNFRQYDNTTKTIICPVCSKEHDYIKTCDCGLTFEQYLDIEIENIKTKTEMNNGKKDS